MPELPNLLSFCHQLRIPILRFLAEILCRRIERLLFTSVAPLSALPGAMLLIQQSSRREYA